MSNKNFHSEHSGGVLSRKNTKNKYNFKFLLTFSTLSVLLHFLPISRYYHNILFSANVFSLIGFSIIIMLFPLRLFIRYGETFRNIINQIGLDRIIPANIYSLNIIAWLLHAIPVYVLWKYNYSLGNPIGWILLYAIFACQYLGESGNWKFIRRTGRGTRAGVSEDESMIIEQLYNLTIMELGLVVLLTSVVFIGIYMNV